jgi:hypothetical protein
MTPAALRERLAKARVATRRDVAERARRGMTAWLEAMLARGETATDLAGQMATGVVASGVAQVELAAATLPGDLACGQGCAFCCILGGADGGTITEAEARALHGALMPFAGAPDGRDWHPRACAALDPATRQCRAYAARPTICRSYVSRDATACEAVAYGQEATGQGTLAAYHGYLAALGLSRAALRGQRRVATYALARIAAAAVEGCDPETALQVARHPASGLEDELKRSKRDLARSQQAGLP